jgi:hypothetical protein
MTGWGGAPLYRTADAGCVAMLDVYMTDGGGGVALCGYGEGAATWEVYIAPLAVYGWEVGVVGCGAAGGDTVWALSLAGGVRGGGGMWLAKCGGCCGGAACCMGVVGEGVLLNVVDSNDGTSKEDADSVTVGACAITVAVSS